jgi:hypothetical protein
MTTRLAVHGILNTLRKKIGEALFAGLVRRLLTRDNILGAIDGLFDFFEHYAQTTETDIDDLLIAQIRDALHIPDKDDDDVPPESID